MEAPAIQATTRERAGTRYARRLRSSGQLPAVIYGHKQDPVSVAVDEKVMLQHLHHGARLFTVTVDGKEETCLIKDLQFGHLGDEIIHVDMTRVDLNEEVEVAVPVQFIGDPVGLKTAGAILRTVNEGIQVRCKVMAIPSELSVSIAHIEAGTHLTAGEVELPTGVELVSEPDLLLCRVTVVAVVEEEPEEVEGEAPAEGEEAAGEPSGEDKPAGGDDES